MKESYLQKNDDIGFSLLFEMLFAFFVPSVLIRPNLVPFHPPSSFFQEESDLA